MIQHCSYSRHGTKYPDVSYSCHLTVDTRTWHDHHINAWWSAYLTELSALYYWAHKICLARVYYSGNYGEQKVWRANYDCMAITECFCKLLLQTIWLPIWLHGQLSHFDEQCNYDCKLLLSASARVQTMASKKYVPRCQYDCMASWATLTAGFVEVGTTSYSPWCIPNPILFQSRAWAAYPDM